MLFRKSAYFKGQKSARKSGGNKISSRKSFFSKSAIPEKGPKKVLEKGDPQKKFKKRFFKKCHFGKNLYFKGPENC